MSFKKIGRIICAAAISGAVLAAPALAGCSTGHPRARITVEFNGESYVLDYTLYRNMYPQTVQHFIELADNGFYNNTIIHNYQSDKWYGGGYSYVDDETTGYAASFEDGTAGMLDYLESTSKEYEYAQLATATNADGSYKLTPSVYRNAVEDKLTEPLTTLIGEFSLNQHKINNGALTRGYGNLGMFYSEKEVDNTWVYLDKTGSPFGVQGNYEYNSATSLFTIQVNTSTSRDTAYCIFGTMDDTSVLDDLTAAVKEVSSDMGGSSAFQNTVTLYVDNFDEFIEPQTNEVTYTVTATPIIIRTVEITRY